MNQSEGIGCADLLIRVLENNGVKHVFGHPGEQILPVYEALRKSNIKHILMRHEQGAAHAADGYARSSAQVGVCLSSAGPGALNLVMGVATAYKDSIPLLVITGDTPTCQKDQGTFQNIDQNKIFQPITIDRFNAKTPEEAIKGLKNAFKILKYRKGPIHINLPKDVISERVNKDLINIKNFIPPFEGGTFDPEITELLEKSDKPLILAGSGIFWSGMVERFRKFVEKNQIPVATTYPGRGVISEENPLCLGMLGLRGTDAANFAGDHADLILAVGCRLSERTMQALGKGKLIHVNLDEKVLKGDYPVKIEVSEFFNNITHIKTKNTLKWLNQLQSRDNFHKIKVDYDQSPMKPQRAIYEILRAAPDTILVNDAGTHTTWVTLLRKVKEPSSLLFSGGFGPMGFGLPAAIGASIAHPEKNIILVTGDGGFQMTSQELAVLEQLQLPIIVVIINNQSLGIIRQWQETYYNGPFQVDLSNPDFVMLARAYNIPGIRLSAPEKISHIMAKVLKIRKPYLIELMVDSREGIPLPRW